MASGEINQDWWFKEYEAASYPLWTQMLVGNTDKRLSDFNNGGSMINLVRMVANNLTFLSLPLKKVIRIEEVIRIPMPSQL